jgi:hypothetical protein
VEEDMGGLKPGSIKAKNGRLSIWRVPNFLLEPRGDYFHESDEFIDRLARLRSIAGGAVVIGMIIYYSGLSHTGYTRKGGLLGGANITTNTPEGGWLAGLIVTISAAILVIPIVALILVLAAERGYRRATVYQLRWIIISAGGFAGLTLVTLGVAAGINYLEKSSMHHLSPVVGIAATIMAIPVAIILLVWFFKSLYLIATGLFRADDAHPLLAPVAGIPIVWIIAFITYFEGGSGGLTGVPETLGKIVAFGGAVSVTIINTMTLIRLKKDPCWAFRRGPVQPAPISPTPGASEMS